jgi:hypothetical protein
MSVVPVNMDDRIMSDIVYKYSEASVKDETPAKLGDEELLALLRKMHELMQKEVEEKQKSEKKDEDSSPKILIAADIKYW